MKQVYLSDGELVTRDGDRIGYLSIYDDGGVAGGGTGATQASELPFTPAGTVAATDTQAAILEVASEAASALTTTVNAHTGDTSDAHDASAISYVPSGSVVATDVQAAIDEVASEYQVAVDSAASVASNALTAHAAEDNTHGGINGASKVCIIHTPAGTAANIYVDNESTPSTPAFLGDIRIVVPDGFFP